MKSGSFFTHSSRSRNRGFTLVELVIGASLFALISVTVYQSYANIITLVSASRVKITATDLLNEQFELVRNLSYEKVGIVNGIPSGVLLATSTHIRDNGTFDISTAIRNVDDPFDGTIGGSPNDLSPADYKVVDLTVTCDQCRNFQPMTVVTRVSPKNLETASSNGALFIRVFDANGQPIKGADVSVVNNKATTTISINDVTDTQGQLAIVDAPPGINAYQITVTKSGYTTDKTYATSTGNPSPTKLHATVLLQQVTQISFVIDQFSEMNISAVTETCAPIASVPFSITGSKLIGTSPDVYKYSASETTNSLGNRLLPGIEWDSYGLVVNSATYRLSGVNPLLPVSVLPGAIQNVQLILNTKNPSQVLVTVKDSATNLPISGATVTLTNTATGISVSLETGRGFFNQSDWSGGNGQQAVGNLTQYDTSDGNVDTGNPVGELKLANSFGTYAPSGNVTSSIFDTGTVSNFSQISWSPTSQPPAVGANSVQFQLATAQTNTASTTWNFVGPDGTAASFYSTSNTNIAGVHSGDRYFKYKAYMSTASTTFSPNIAEASITVTTSCTPPGQVLFSGLAAGTYAITVNASGYSQGVGSVDVPNNSSYIQQSIILSP